MTVFPVKMMPHGMLDGKPDRKIEAASIQEAAELAFGGPLLLRGMTGNAQVQVTTFTRSGRGMKTTKTIFYSSPG